MITGKDILCISSIDWDFIWQGHQEIMARLASQGNRVLFVENTGVRPPRLRDLPRVRHRLRNWWRGTRGFREEQENLFVFSPVVLPFPYSRAARWINATFLLRTLRRWMRATDFRRPILWTFLPTPLVRDLIRGLNARLTVYYCVDDLGSSSPGARKITRSENHVLREADLVFVTSEKLRARAAEINEHVYVFPFGVDYESFERVRLGADEVPRDIGRLPRPIIGYVGGLHQWVDQSLVCAVADAMPDASVALVGPSQADISELQRRPNVHVLGARPHGELPKYIKAFDVGLVPYRLSEYTDHVYPTKLNEYLAMGIPVVATDLPELLRFRDRYGDILATPHDLEGFVSAVRTALEPSSRDVVERRLQVAQDNSWLSRVGEMGALMDRALEVRERTSERWEVVFGRLYRTAQRRTGQAAALLLVVCLGLFYTPVLWVVASPLLVVDSPQPADAIVVFGGGVGESGRAGGSYQERVGQAVDLYRGGFAEHVVFSSGFVYAFKEAEVMRALAADQGVFASDIFLETRAGSTRENVLFVREIAQREGWRQVLLVSSPYHMRRAILTWRKLAPGIAATSTPAEGSQYYAHGFGASLEQIRGIAQEYAALAYYWAKGWI